MVSLFLILLMNDMQSLLYSTIYTEIMYESFKKDQIKLF